MKKPIFIFLFLLFFTSFASANLGLSHGKLEFNIDIGEKACEVVTVSSGSYEGEVVARDIWAETIDEERNFNFYTYSADDHGITLDYIDTIVEFEKEFDVEVCLEAEEVGEFKGALIFAPEAETNIVIEKGVWLLVNVQEAKVEPEPPQQETPPANTGGSSGGGGSSGEKVLVDIVLDEKVEEVKAERNVEELSVEFAPANEDAEKQETTEEVGSGDEKSKIGIIYFIPIALIAFVVMISVYIVRVRRKGTK